jgi:hypothetical protein
MSVNLDVFRNAKTLAWKRWTVFEPHGWTDGTLFAYDANGDEVAKLPLDTYTEETARGVLPRDEWGKPITSNGVGIVWVGPATLDELHAAVRAWCSDQIGRVDVEFP